MEPVCLVNFASKLGKPRNNRNWSQRELGAPDSDCRSRICSAILSGTGLPTAWGTLNRHIADFRFEPSAGPTFFGSRGPFQTYPRPVRSQSLTSGPFMPWTRIQKDQKTVLMKVNSEKKQIRWKSDYLQRAYWCNYSVSVVIITSFSFHPRLHRQSATAHSQPFIQGADQPVGRAYSPHQNTTTTFFPTYYLEEGIVRDYLAAQTGRSKVSVNFS